VKITVLPLGGDYSFSDAREQVMKWIHPIWVTPSGKPISLVSIPIFLMQDIPFAAFGMRYLCGAFNRQT
jgi:hypothetical protein